MRFDLLLVAASVVSAGSLLPRQKPNAPKAPKAPNLPANNFPSFPTISLDDARKGKDLPNGFNNTPPTADFARPATFSAADAGACAARPNMRREWKRYPRADRLAFMNAIRCLINRPPSGNFSPARNRFEDFVRLHQRFMPNIHGNPKFLIWHRYYLWTFEQVLRSECGFNRDFPWWDETLDAGRFAQSDIFGSDYFGALPTSNSGPVCITNGAFAGLTCNIGPGQSNRAHCLSRRVDESLTANSNADFVRTCNNRNSYADMASCAEGGPHAYGHNGMGGVMADVWASPSDPIFWMHHAFVDHGLRIWQNGAPSRRTTINGKDVHGNDLTLDTWVDVGGIRPNVRIRDILDTMGGIPIGGVPFCYRYDY
ncbi:hypothetical protein FQN57_001443 [Myotisia sp. PD_48]|nr:hypothetical protein FQN57_001443 [Myotisia sp. PD_48]